MVFRCNSANHPQEPIFRQHRQETQPDEGWRFETTDCVTCILCQNRIIKTSYYLVLLGTDPANQPITKGGHSP